MIKTRNNTIYLLVVDAEKKEGAMYSPASNNELSKNKVRYLITCDINKLHLDFAVKEYLFESMMKLRMRGGKHKTEYNPYIEEEEQIKNISDFFNYMYNTYYGKPNV